MSGSVKRLPVSDPSVYAFEISGEVSAEAMESMAETMNAAFDAHTAKINMMLVFRNFEGSESGSMWDGDVITSRFRALTNIDKYVVVGAPEKAESMIETFGKLIPVEAHTYDLADIDQAWSFLGVESPVTNA